MNFSGHPYFLSSCRSPVLPTVSNALRKSTNNMYSGRSCSMHFSCSCRRQNTISMVLRLTLKPHCVSGTTSGVTWVDSLLRRILSKILPAMAKERFLYSSHSLFDHLSCRWLQCWHPSMLVVQNPPPRHWWLVGAVYWTDCLLHASIPQQESHLPQVLCHLLGQR